MKLYDHQQTVARSPARFKVFRSGRRSGKTVLKTETMIYKGVSRINHDTLTREFKNPSVIFVAPTAKQARTIIWESLKTRLEGIDKIKFNEQRLEVRIPTEQGGVATLFVGGWENRENYRGMSNVIHVEFDETDTMKDFFIGWEEIFKPMLMETGGSAGFAGTPKKESPNLRRLEKEAEDKPDWRCFHFTSWDNPLFSREELEKAREEMEPETYKQEIMAEYVDNAGALFKYDALVDMFSNTITKSKEKYLVVDIADDGSDKTVFTFWQGLELYRVEKFARLNTEGVVNQIREYQAQEQIPMSQTLVDAIGVGAGVSSNSMLDGIVGYKSSFGAIRTDEDPTKLPNVHYTKAASLTTEYANLRSQCVFTLSRLVNNHEVACKITDPKIKEEIIEELALYQDASKGDGKRMPTIKDDIKALLGRSPDTSDALVMRMYFEVRNKLSPGQSEDAKERASKVGRQFMVDSAFREQNSNK